MDRRCGGTRVAGETGLIVAPENVTELADVMKMNFRGEQVLRVPQGGAGLQRVYAVFSRASSRVRAEVMSRAVRLGRPCDSSPGHISCDAT